MHEFESVEQITIGRVGPGTRYRCRRRKGPATEWGFRWVEFEPGSRLVWEGDGGGPVRRRGTYTLSPDGPGRTRVHVLLEPRPIFPVSLLAPILQRIVRGHVHRDTERLRRWLAGALGGAWFSDAADLLESAAALAIVL